MQPFADYYTSAIKARCFLILFFITYSTKSKKDSGNFTLIPPILGYAKPGSATGKLLYANYGRQQDFQTLRDIYKTTCHGYVVIMRYGKGYRGDKVNVVKWQQNMATKYQTNDLTMTL